MKISVRMRSVASLLMVFCLLATPLTVFAAKKGEKNFKQGLQYESAQQWERAAQEFTLAVAADPSNAEYQLHYRRSVFNASQQYMQQGRALAEQHDYVGAYNAFRQAYGYDPVNLLALSEMERMLRLQREKESDSGNGPETKSAGPQIRPTAYRLSGDGTGATPSNGRSQQDQTAPRSTSEQLRVITYSGDLKQFIRNLATELGLNVIFDTQSFRQPRTIEVNLRNVTTSQALDYVFLQEGLFFQKISRRTILVADQTRRPQYQQLVIRTFYLSNIDPQDARNLITAAIPPNQGRPQAIVLPDKATNSITVRDTAENIRLIGDILQSIDKDRAEVVMDVNIYEVGRTDLLQFGNQIGSADGSVISLAGSSGVRAVVGSQQVASQVLNSVPTAAATAFILPASTLSAFQNKNRSRLLASTQVHAFNGEESSARIGQRVPVQTAQVYGFNNTGTTTGGTGTASGVYGSNGYPVIQYEPTGLTLKFTPQVFPNLDVQVKMSIESKDILGAGSLTPTFTERTLTGTARIQNNRTMMLASVAQDTQSNGRRGLPVLGLIPVLGRLFTSPTRNNNQTDIVIAVTPRVLRAPAVTPSDELMRPSGTLQTPTTGSLEALVQEAEREEQLAAARSIPTNTVVQLPDAETPAYIPAPQSSLPDNKTTAAAAPASTQPGGASVTTNVSNTTATNNIADAASTQSAPSQGSLNVAAAMAQYLGAPQANTSANVVGKSTETPKPLSLSATQPPQPSTLTATEAEPPPDAAATATQEQATPAPSYARPATSGKSSVVEKTASGIFGNAPATTTPPAATAELRLMPTQAEMRVGEKQRLALTLIASTPLNSAMVRLRFDPRFIAVRGISQGDSAKSAPTVMQSIDPSGIVTISLMPPVGVNFKTGASVLVFLDIEAVAPGESAFSFEKDSVSLSFTGTQLAPQLFESKIVVK